MGVSPEPENFSDIPFALPRPLFSSHPPPPSPLRSLPHPFGPHTLKLMKTIRIACGLGLPAPICLRRMSLNSFRKKKKSREKRQKQKIKKKNWLFCSDVIVSSFHLRNWHGGDSSSRSTSRMPQWQILSGSVTNFLRLHHHVYYIHCEPFTSLQLLVIKKQ